MARKYGTGSCSARNDSGVGHNTSVALVVAGSEGMVLEDGRMCGGQDMLGTDEGQDNFEERGRSQPERD